MRTEPFLFHNGRAAHTVHDLLAVIEESSQAIYDEHVNSQRNDFASWIDLSLHEHKLANELRKSKDRLGTIVLLRSWLKAHPFDQAPHFLQKTHQKEFLFGFLFGLIVGIILLRIIQVLA